MNAARLAACERRLRPLLVRLPPALGLRLFSQGRRTFIQRFVRQTPSPIMVANDRARTLWGLRFRVPLGNAAGMFKDGRGYAVVAAQGAGFYLAGTTTARPRAGNRRAGVLHPFVPYPRSGAASNWLGLPNEGHAVVASRLAKVARVDGCPLGASVAADPGTEQSEQAKLDGLVAGLTAYAEAGVDMLELNESCPNTEDEGSALEDLAGRLAHVRRAFLDRRQRRLPVVVKLSCDTPRALVADLVDLIVDHGFDGVNFGNTSTDYARHRGSLDARERARFDRFAQQFGGGLSGRPLRVDARELVRAAADHLHRRSAPDEFHVIATGGIETVADLDAALDAGASIGQWYTGYFEAFGNHGHGLYRALFGAA